MKLGSNPKREYTQLPRTDWQARAEEATDIESLPQDLPAAEPKYDFASLTRQDEPTDEPARPEECSSVIGAGSTWQGNFSTEGSVRLEGRVKGEVKAAGTVHITEGAEVNATVNGKFIVIAGSFDGKLFCSDRVVLQPTSKVRGSITTRLFSVGEGAFIDGEVHMVDELPATAAASSSSARSTDALFGDATAEAKPEEPRANGKTSRTRV